MAFVATCLLVAVAAACFVIVALVGVLYDLSVKRNEAEDRAEHLEDEADALQEQLNAALNRLSRKRKPSVAAAAAEDESEAA